MDGSFACPECGNELQLKGTSPGRQLRCGWCETWVEVPFLPRTLSRARYSRSRPAWVPWAWAGLGVLALLVVGFGSARWYRSRARARLELTVAELVAEATTSEAAGHPDQALAAISKAIKEARRFEPPRPERIAELEGRRNVLARRTVESQFEAASRATPGAAIATYKALLTRVWRDPALAGLEVPIHDRLEATRRSWAEADAAAARKAVDAGRPHEAIDLCERLVVTAEELPHETFERLYGQANEIVTALIERRGVVFLPARGDFTDGSPQSYSERFDPLFDALFRTKGYVPRRPASPWRADWDNRSPFRLTMDVVERQGGAYSSSNNRITIISAKLNLARGDLSIWKLGPLVAQTQPSIPSLAAFTAARGGPDDHPSEALDKILYTDAWDSLRERIKAQLGTVPVFRAPPR
jgi:hypothetical protein